MPEIIGYDYEVRFLTPNLDRWLTKLWKKILDLISWPQSDKDVSNIGDDEMTRTGNTLLTSKTKISQMSGMWKEC